MTSPIILKILNKLYEETPTQTTSQIVTKIIVKHTSFSNPRAVNDMFKLFVSVGVIERVGKGNIFNVNSKILTELGVDV
jgi:hypothetical protein